MKKILVFFISILVCLIILDRIISFSLDKLYSKNFWGESGGNINYFLSRQETTDLLIIGDSRAHRHIIPDSFSVKTFSLCHHGMNLIFHTGLLHILEQQKKLPENILLHLEHNEFAQPNGFSSDNKDIQHLRYFYGINPYVTDKINHLSSTEWVLYFWKSYRYNGKLISLIKNYYLSRKEHPNHSGFEPLLPEKLDSFRVISEVKQIELENASETNLTIDTFSIALLSDFISVCKRNNIKLACFVSPYYFKPGKKHQLSNVFLSQFLKEKGVSFMDFCVNRPSEYDNLNLWRDSYHLNIDGAKILTHQLKLQTFDFYNSKINLDNN